MHSCNQRQTRMHPSCCRWHVGLPCALIQTLIIDPPRTVQVPSLSRRNSALARGNAVSAMRFSVHPTPTGLIPELTRFVSAASRMFVGWSARWRCQQCSRECGCKLWRVQSNWSPSSPTLRCWYQLQPSLCIHFSRRVEVPQPTSHHKSGTASVPRRGCAHLVLHRVRSNELAYVPCGLISSWDHSWVKSAPRPLVLSFDAWIASTARVTACARTASSLRAAVPVVFLFEETSTWSSSVQMGV